MLTATPLQNSLLELYGLSTLIDDHLLGDVDSFRSQFMAAGSSLAELRNRLGGTVQHPHARIVPMTTKYERLKNLLLELFQLDKPDLDFGICRIMHADYFAGSGSTGHALLNLHRSAGDRRRGLLIEMGAHFETVTVPRLRRITFTPDWSAGAPARPATALEEERSPRIMKVLRLESYEDTLNNLDLRRDDHQQSLLDSPAAVALREGYTLRYMLDVESRGSQSLLNVAAFTDPTAYQLNVKSPGSDESRLVNADLLETFNYLIGLTVVQITAPRSFTATFERDPEKRLQIASFKQAADGPHWFRTVTGTSPDGQRVLVIWRKRPGGDDPDGVEQDNAVLDHWFTNKQQYSVRDSEFDAIYVNGDNNLENMKRPDETWKVRLIEEDFHRLMFDSDGML